MRRSAFCRSSIDGTATNTCVHHVPALTRVGLQVREDQPYRLAVSSFIQSSENYIDVVKCARQLVCGAGVVFVHRAAKRHAAQNSRLPCTMHSTAHH